MSRFDPDAVLHELDRREVRFVIIGGMAAALLGSPLITGDLDICYDRAPDNLDRLAAALVELQATLRGAPPDVPFLLDAKTLAAGDCFTFDTKHGPLDILGTPAGMRGGYAELVKRTVRFDLGGLEVNVASLDDLIAMKRAAGRPKDRVAVEVLGALRNELEGR